MLWTSVPRRNARTSKWKCWGWSWRGGRKHNGAIRYTRLWKIGEIGSRRKGGKKKESSLFETREKQVYFERLEGAPCCQNRVSLNEQRSWRKSQGKPKREEKEKRGMFKQRRRSRKKGTHKNMKKESGWHLKQHEKNAKVRTGKGHKQMHKHSKRGMNKEMHNARLKQSTMMKLNPRLRLKTKAGGFAPGRGNGHCHPHQKGSKRQRERRKWRELEKTYAMTTLSRRKWKTRKSTKSSSASINLGSFLCEWFWAQKKTSSTSKNKESHWAPSTREVFTSRKFTTSLRHEIKLDGLLPPFPWGEWKTCYLLGLGRALCPIGEARLVESCCWWSARPLTRSVRNAQSSSWWSPSLSFFVGRVLPRCAVGVRLCFIFHRTVTSCDSPLDILHNFHKSWEGFSCE